MHKILIVATSKKTRGGITSVVNAHRKGQQWRDYNCIWIETHRDHNFIIKIWMLLIGFIKYLIEIPNCDIVHIHTSEPPSALRKAIIFMPIALALRKKIIVHFHAFSPETTINGKFRIIYKYMFSNADRVVVLSEFWKKEVQKAFPRSHVIIIYNPCLIEFNQEQENLYVKNIHEHQKYILFAGTINQRKGYSDLIKAFANISKEFKDWYIVFAGNGEIEQGQALAKKLGIENQTKWLGWVNGKEKEAAYKNASIFCLPSYAEGFPMSVLDAWSYCLPVITTPVGGIPDVAIDCENMLLFKPGDIEALSVCIKKMITNETLRAKISEASYNFAKNDFNLNTINSQIGHLYASLLDKKTE